MNEPMKKVQAKSAGSFTPWNRLTLCMLAAGAVLVLTVIVGSVAAYSIFRVTQPANNDEKVVLATLEKAFDASHKLDEKLRIMRLDLEGSHVGNEVIDEVVKCKFLKELSLAQSRVNDSGLKKLCELKRLELLGLCNTPVTDVGLRELEKMPSLRHLWVCENDGLTNYGIAALKKANPGLSIHVIRQVKS